MIRSFSVITDRGQMWVVPADDHTRERQHWQREWSNLAKEHTKLYERYERWRTVALIAIGVAALALLALGYYYGFRRVMDVGTKYSLTAAVTCGLVAVFRPRRKSRREGAIEGRDCL